MYFDGYGSYGYAPQDVDSISIGSGNASLGSSTRVDLLTPRSQKVSTTPRDTARLNAIASVPPPPRLHSTAMQARQPQQVGRDERWDVGSMDREPPNLATVAFGALGEPGLEQPRPAQRWDDQHLTEQWTKPAPSPGVDMTGPLVSAMEEAFVKHLTSLHEKLSKEIQAQGDRVMEGLSSVGMSMSPGPSRRITRAMSKASHLTTDSRRDAGGGGAVIREPSGSIRPSTATVVTADAPGDVVRLTTTMTTTESSAGRNVASMPLNVSGSALDLTFEDAEPPSPPSRKQQSRARPTARGSEVAGIAEDGYASENMAENNIARSVTLAVRRPGLLARIMTHQAFDSTISMVIFMNCVTIGCQAHLMLQPDASADLLYLLEVSEHVFTAIFTLEGCSRLFVFGLGAFNPFSSFGRPNFADACLVFFTGILLTWGVPLFTLISRKQVDADVLRMFLVLRALRLTRLVLILRKHALFREAWMLIRGLKDSCTTLVWTCVVIFLVTYMFAIFGLTAIAADLQKQREGITDPEALTSIDGLIVLFGGIDRFMYTMIQVLMQDSFNQFMRELLVFQPSSWIFFYTYIGLANFVLMNLVTAIIVENALSTAQQDHDHQIQEMEKQRTKEIKSMSNLFEIMDSDGSGTLSWDEFQTSFADPELLKRWQLLEFHPRDCKQLFELLDDGDGEIETKEFFEGLEKMKGPAGSKDVFLVTKRLEALAGSVDDLVAATADGDGTVGGPHKRRVNSKQHRDTTARRQSKAARSAADRAQKLIVAKSASSLGGLDEYGDVTPASSSGAESPKTSRTTGLGLSHPAVTLDIAAGGNSTDRSSSPGPPVDGNEEGVFSSLSGGPKSPQNKSALAVSVGELKSKASPGRAQSPRFMEENASKGASSQAQALSQSAQGKDGGGSGGMDGQPPEQPRRIQEL